MRVLAPYYDAPEYIQALAHVTRRSLGAEAPDHVVISFHGLPTRYATLGDPYPEQCRETATVFAKEMGWDPSRVTVSFQSRFGREEWLRPYTDETLDDLATRGRSRIATCCPGFTADCRETLEEMGITNRERYHARGGGDYQLIPCLNDDDVWLDGLTTLVLRDLQGWVGPEDSSNGGAGLKTGRSVS